MHAKPYESLIDHDKHEVKDEVQPKNYEQENSDLSKQLNDLKDQF